METKKLIFALGICCVAMPGFAAPQVYTAPGSSKDGISVVYYPYKTVTKFKANYISLRAELSFLNWTNKYSTDLPGVQDAFDGDKYSMESFFGGNVAFGHRFDSNWRAEGEVGYIGKFTDKDDGWEFGLSIPYLMANGYYDFDNGLYAGLGLGLAMPNIELDGGFTDNGNRSKRSFGVIGGLSFGYVHKLSDSFALDLRYRLSGISGTKHSREIMSGGDTYDFTVKTGFIMDNSISLGIRYEF